MANKPKNPMPIGERAKQFLPFQAVKGLDEALEKKERELSSVEKAQLSEEQIAGIMECIGSLTLTDTVAVVYYAENRYQTLIGTIEENKYKKDSFHESSCWLANENGYITVAAVRIPLNDIYSIKIL